MSFSALPRSVSLLGLLLVAACSSSPAAPPPDKDLSSSTRQSLAEEAGTKLARKLKVLSEEWPEALARDAEQRAYLRLALSGEHADELAETLTKALADSPVALTADPEVKGLVLLGAVAVEGVEHSLSLKLVDPQRALLVFVTREARLVMRSPGAGEAPLERPSELLDGTVRDMVRKLARLHARGWPRTLSLSPTSGKPGLICDLEHPGLQTRALAALSSSDLVDLQLSGAEAEALGAAAPNASALVLRGGLSDLEDGSSCTLSIYDVEGKRVLVRSMQVERVFSPR